ncbi:MAG: precorrin-4 C(11)-methyltransferase, partial [Pseudomonadota bacterium]
MTVYFIGAGPGAADLITVRGQELIKNCPVCLYAGSLVPEALIAQAPRGVIVLDTAAMVLDEIIAHIVKAHAKGQNVARVHSGDPSLYGAIGEQIERLKNHDIPYEIVPGVPAYCAAAAAIGQELTKAGVCQSIVLTRTSMRASAMPSQETLENFATTGALLAIHLSITNLAKVVRDLTPHYGETCPVVVGYRIGWSDEMVIRGTLQTIRKAVKAANITRTALIMVGPSLDSGHGIQNDSA